MRAALFHTPAPPVPRRAAGCTLWWAPLDAARPGHAALLTPHERARAERFARGEDRTRSLLNAALLRLAVPAETGTPAAAVDVVRRCGTCAGPHGRPTLPGTGLSVSLSHAGRRVVVALSRDGDVGVDVERRTGLDAAALAGALAPQEAAGDPLRLWVRKEAVLKATGEGLTVEPREVVVARGDGVAAPVAHPLRPGLVAAVRDLAPDDDHVAAVALLGAGFGPGAGSGSGVGVLVVREHDAAPLLG
ncbi:4'-phosphopantetheinyl transferase family protein [Kineococcus glutinatus]|uniref:4'-phosphopantetheinyl transferase n=1 Tax=Kineococcus glutinatus TaxID=1070872 RepID=A0ABP9HZV3_9ACTN